MSTTYLTLRDKVDVEWRMTIAQGSEGIRVMILDPRAEGEGGLKFWLRAEDVLTLCDLLEMLAHNGDAMNGTEDRMNRLVNAGDSLRDAVQDALTLIEELSQAFPCDGDDGIPDWSFKKPIAVVQTECEQALEQYRVTSAFSVTP